jgi:hypothetical protein
MANWENLQEEFLFWTQVLLASLSSMPLLQYDLLVHKHLLHSLIFGCVGEYFGIAYCQNPSLGFVTKAGTWKGES